MTCAESDTTALAVARLASRAGLAEAFVDAMSRLHKPDEFGRRCTGCYPRKWPCESFRLLCEYHQKRGKTK